MTVVGLKLPNLWEKLQKVDFSYVRNEVVLSFRLAGMSLCDISCVLEGTDVAKVKLACV